MAPLINSNTMEFEFLQPDLNGLLELMSEKAGFSNDKTKEILLPVIKEIEKHRSSMIQSRIQDYFPQGSNPSRLSKRVVSLQFLILNWLVFTVESELF